MLSHSSHRICVVFGTPEGCELVKKQSSQILLDLYISL